MHKSILTLTGCSIFSTLSNCKIYKLANKMLVILLPMLRFEFFLMLKLREVFKNKFAKGFLLGNSEVGKRKWSDITNLN